MIQTTEEERSEPSAGSTAKAAGAPNKISTVGTAQAASAPSNSSSVVTTSTPASVVPDGLSQPDWVWTIVLVVVWIVYRAEEPDLLRSDAIRSGYTA